MTRKLSWLIESLHVNEEGVVYNRDDLPVELYNKTSGGYGWIHLDGTSSDAKSWLKNGSGIDEIWVDALLATETRPRLVKIDDNTIFINLRGINSFNKEEPEDMISIRLYVTKQQIISVKLRNLKAVTKLKMDFESSRAPKTTFEFLLTLIEHINEEIESTIADIYEAIDDLEEMVLIEHDKDFRQNVIDVRRQVIIFRRYFFPNLDTLQQLAAIEGFLGSGADNASNLSESCHKMTRFIEEIVSIRERAQVIHEELNNHLTERLSASTNKLSAIASIFLPMSFVTGLFGVNLAGIPGAASDKSFPIFAGIICAILIVQFVILKWKKWF